MNPWIEHIKKFAKDRNITYWEAIKMPECKASYKRGKGLLDDLKKREIDSKLKPINTPILDNIKQTIANLDRTNPLNSPRPTIKGGKKTYKG